MGIICLLDTFDVFVSVILVLYLFLVSVSGIQLYHMLYQLHTKYQGSDPPPDDDIGCNHSNYFRLIEY